MFGDTGNNRQLIYRQKYRDSFIGVVIRRDKRCLKLA